LDTPSKELFKALIQGNFPKFAHQLRLVESGTTSFRILGSKESVYQAFLYAFFKVVSQNYSPVYPWVIQSESDGEMGRLDLVMWHPNDHRAVIQVYNNNKLTNQDKNGEFDESKSRQLTTLSEDGLKQVQEKNYPTSSTTNLT